MTVDESMVMWVGTGDMHLTYIPRKPTPLGIMMKTVVDSDSGILMGAELCEAAGVMDDYEYQREWGASVATTLRLMKPFANAGRIAIGDAWFGSIRTVYALKTLQGTYAIMVVKNRSKGYPKSELKEQCKERGDVVCMELKGLKDPRDPSKDVPMYATAHMDKAPLTLVHNCDTINAGVPRVRYFARYSKDVHKVVRARFQLEQPSVAATYRDRFWAVDKFNKIALGPHSVMSAFRTLDWKVRFFATMLAMAETNAYLAYNYKAKQLGQTELTRHEWKEALGLALLDRPFDVANKSLRAREDKGDEMVQPSLLSLLDNHGVVMGRTDRKSLVCVECKASDQQKKMAPYPRSHY